MTRVAERNARVPSAVLASVWAPSYLARTLENTLPRDNGASMRGALTVASIDVRGACNLVARTLLAATELQTRLLVLLGACEVARRCVRRQPRACACSGGAPFHRTWSSVSLTTCSSFRSACFTGKARTRVQVSPAAGG